MKLIDLVNILFVFVELFNVLKLPITHLEKLLQMTGVSNSKEIKGNFSKSDLKECGAMFIALNSCPSFLERLYWRAFYESKNTATIALFASNIIKHSQPNLKMKAQRVFAKIAPVLGFKHIWYKHDNNQSFEKNVELMKNITDIKGEKIQIINCKSNHYLY